jgi:uncharacterized protein
MNRYIINILFSLLTLNIVFGQIPETPTNYVNDYSGTLSVTDEQMLNRKLAAYEDTTSTQIFIVLTNDHQDQEINQLGAEIGENWGAGQKGEDNGLVILMYPEARKVAIQTGYAIEQYVPDAIAKRIIEREMIPAFKENDFAGGLNRATDVIMNLLSGKFTADEYRKQTSSSPLLFGLIIFLILFFTIFGGSRKRRYGSVGKSLPLWLALSMLSGSRNSHRGSWGGFSGGGGGFSGGFGGGGGGSFGGGGASGSW